MEHLDLLRMEVVVEVDHDVGEERTCHDRDPAHSLGSDVLDIGEL